MQTASGRQPGLIPEVARFASVKTFNARRAPWRSEVKGEAALVVVSTSFISQARV